MNKNNIKKKIIKLKKKINKYSFYYFSKNKNLISDEEYDLLVNKLHKLKKKYPKYKNIKVNKKKYIFKKKLKKNKHSIPMLSIKSIYSLKKIYKYINKIKLLYNKKKFCCELKIDGIAISLIYKNNYLNKSLTRGNGIYGENITSNIKEIKSIPKILNTKKKYSKIEIRGELYIKTKNFLKINKKNKFSNSRNFVSGTIRKINKNTFKKRKLSFIAYDLILKNKRYKKKNQYKCLNKLKKFGFNIDKNTKLCSSFKEIIYFYKKIKKKRKINLFDIDGIVIKINNRKLQEKIGNNKKNVKWCISWKFPTKKKTTILKKIKLKVGKNGIITPIGIIKEINIGGTKINKINLYNLNYLSKLSLKKKNKIIIERSGDVIPCIKEIIKEKNKKKILIPNICPSCKNKINLNDKIPKCNLNFSCPEQIKKIIINFISKNGFNIKWIGPKIIKKLIKYKYIKNITDIFFISKKKIISVPGIKIKLAKKIIHSINYSKKNIKLKNLIYSLSIPNIGINTSIYISSKLNKFKNFIFLNKKKLKKINKKKIKSITKYIKNKKNLINLILLKKILKKSKNKNI